MKKILLATATIAALSTSAYAMGADTGFYARIDGGASQFSNSNVDTTYTLGAGIGYNASDSFRADFLYNFTSLDRATTFTNPITNQKTTIRGGKINFNSLLLNGYYDYDLEAVKFFVGAGIGSMFTTSDGATSSSDFQYAIHTGVSTELTDGINAELAYKWNHVLVDAPGTAGFHNVTLGLRFDI